MSIKSDTYLFFRYFLLTVFMLSLLFWHDQLLKS